MATPGIELETHFRDNIVAPAIDALKKEIAEEFDGLVAPLIKAEVEKQLPALVEAEVAKQLSPITARLDALEAKFTGAGIADLLHQELDKEEGDAKAASIAAAGIATASAPGSTALDPNAPVEPTPNVVANPDPLATPQGPGTNVAGNDVSAVAP